jgi:putative intracellular protease/amidase
MAHVLIPLPARDFDPSEAAISWKVLTRLGHRVSFATPAAEPAEADDIMLTGRGLDPWSRIPGLGRLRLIGLVLRANANARAAYAEMTADPAYRRPLRWEAARVEDYDGLLLPGGHRARGMRDYIDSPVLQALVVEFFRADKPVAAICHGVLLAARSRDPRTGRSALHGRKTTALTWRQEGSASAIARISRFWDPLYYRTYPEAAGQPAGFMSVEAEAKRALASPDDFLDVPAEAPDHWRKTSNVYRDTMEDARPAWVARDGAYVSARWPGDAHTFAKTFASVLAERRS